MYSSSSSSSQRINHHPQHQPVHYQGLLLVMVIIKILTQYIGSNLLHILKDQDLNQMKYVFNSIDIDRDGQLSLSEMKKFASEIRSVPPLSCMTAELVIVDATCLHGPHTSASSA